MVTTCYFRRARPVPISPATRTRSALPVRYASGMPSAGLSVS
jgi:hypothetical protein